MQARKVVVIGSGPGGSGVAALLGHAGDSVTLVEKNGFLGGKCSSLKKDGFVVDTGVHMFGQGPSGPFGQIAATVGQKLGWCLKEPMIDLYISGKGPLYITHDFLNPIGFMSMLRGRLKGWFDMEVTKNLFGILRKYSLKELGVVKRHMDNPSDYMTEYEDVSVKDFFTSVTGTRDFLRDIVTLTMITMVVSWERASLADFLYIVGTTTNGKGFGYPAGGAGEIIQTFLRGFEERGNTIRTHTPVKRIEVEKGRVTGVTTGSGEFIPADIVISNAGIHRTIEMAGPKNFPREYLDRAAQLKMSSAFIATKYFLDRKITGMRSPCMFHLPEIDPSDTFAYLENGTVPDDLLLFITAPGKSDPSLAPPGKELLIVGVPAPCEVSKASQCEALLDRAEHIAETRLFPEMAGAITGKQRGHVMQTSGLTGRATGECIGLAQEVGQTGTKKPKPQTPVKGLYLVGSDAGGKGIGTECAADSALYLYKLLT